MEDVTGSPVMDLAAYVKSARKVDTKTPSSDTPQNLELDMISDDLDDSPNRSKNDDGNAGNVSLNDISSLDSTTVKNLCVSTSLRSAAEDAKKTLTYNSTVEVTCTPPFSQGMKDTAVTVTLTKDDFELGCEVLFIRSMAPVLRLLTDLGILAYFNLYYFEQCTM